MNKRQAKKYFKKNNNTVEQHKSNTRSVKRRGAHNKYYISVKLKPQPEIKGFGAYEGRKTYFSGPFDEFGAELKGYLRAAQSAGNRIEYTHPGFFATYSKLGPKVLVLIFDNYANYHSSSFYDANESFVDEAQYEFLIDVLDEELYLFNKEFGNIGEI